MLDAIRTFFASDFMPHGVCYRWSPPLIWLHVLSDTVIAIAYFSIPAALLVLVRRRSDFRHYGLLALFAAFILLCGTTHLLEIWSVWHGTYWLSGTVKALTGAASAATAILLWPLIPTFLRIPSPQLLERSKRQLDLETERHRHTERRRASTEHQFRAAFDHAPIGVALVTPYGRWLEVNAALCRIIGRKHADLLTTDFRAFQHGDDAANDEEHIRALLAGEIDTYQVEKRYIRPDGSVVWTLHSVSLVLDARGRPLHFVAQIQDLTELKLEILRREAEATELARSNRELEQFAYIASHDLQEPLRTVSSFTELFERRYGQNLDQRGLDYMAFIVDGARSMRQLIDDLLSFSRVNSEEISFEEVDPTKVLDGVLTLLHTSIEKSSARIEVSGEMAPVVGDRRQLQQLMQNLVANSLKFVVDGRPPEIEITFFEQDRHWGFSIRDNGLGIEPEYQERIFRIFTRLHTKEEFEGSGVGLAICRRIAERHQGSIDVASSAREGSTFTVTLAREPRRADETRSRRSTLSLASPDTPTSRSAG